MTPLLDALYVYGEEHRMDCLCATDTEELRQSEARGEALMEQLNALGGESARLAKQLRFERDTSEILHAQAAFLAGLSVGLELGSYCRLH